MSVMPTYQRLPARQPSLTHLTSPFLSNIQPMAWFHGKISREEVDKLLCNSKTQDGTYLVRESTNFPGDYTLCV